MELDLLAAAETESDSESNHSNQDNASGRRSVVTAATAGSEAGWSTAVFPSYLELLFNFLFNLPELHSLLLFLYELFFWKCGHLSY